MSRFYEIYLKKLLFLFFTVTFIVTGFDTSANDKRFQNNCSISCKKIVVERKKFCHQFQNVPHWHTYWKNLGDVISIKITNIKSGEQLILLNGQHLSATLNPEMPCLWLRRRVPLFYQLPKENFYKQHGLFVNISVFQEKQRLYLITNPQVEQRSAKLFSFTERKCNSKDLITTKII